MYRATKIYGYLELAQMIAILLVMALFIQFGIYRPGESSWLELRIIVELAIIAYCWHKLIPYRFHCFVLQRVFSCTPKQARRAKKWYRSAQKQAQRKNQNHHLAGMIAVAIVVAGATSVLLAWLNTHYPENLLLSALSHSWLKYWYLSVFPIINTTIPAFSLLTQHEKRKGRYFQ